MQTGPVVSFDDRGGDSCNQITDESHSRECNKGVFPLDHDGVSAYQVISGN